MSEVLISAVAFIVAIGILVAVHEWGHFIVARFFGIKVLRFSIGFGRPLWQRRSGPDATEYCISAIPIGGYVKLLDDRDCEVEPAERHRTFNAQPVPARIAVLVAGPLLNFLFAILAYACMFMIGVPGSKPVIGAVESESIAASAGLGNGDVIVGVGARDVATWEGTVIGMLDELLGSGDIQLRVQQPGGPVRTATLRTAGMESELTEPGRLFETIGMTPFSPTLPPVLDEIVADGAAAAAGLMRGDEILSADGDPVESWPDWVEYVRARPGERVAVTIARDGRVLAVDMVIGTAQDADGSTIGRIGASVLVPESLYEGLRAVQRYGPVTAATTAVTKTWDMSVLTVMMVARMVTGDVSVKNISGPINIAQYAGYSARVGLAPFLSFLAVVSISLGILNLLPIPMLDGGQIVYQLAEAAKGSPLSERAQLIGQQMGIALLLLLMSFAFYNDLTRLFG